MLPYELKLNHILLIDYQKMIDPFMNLSLFN